MHSAISAVRGQLKEVLTQLRATIPSDEPFGNAHNNWTFPGLTRAELVEEAESLVTVTEEMSDVQIDDERAAALNDYVRRLNHLASQTVPNIWGNSAQGVSAYMLTMGGLRRALDRAMPVDTKTATAAASSLRRLLAQVRSMEARLKELDPRTASLADLITRIEDAHAAADQLPTDLDSLSEARSKLEILLSDATKDYGHIEGLKSDANILHELLVEREEEASAVLGRCQTAYSAATSVGLAAAFTERSSALSKSMWFWVAGLVVALVAGSHFGSAQLMILAEVLNRSDASTFVVAFNIVISLLSVGAPVWFGWLATKQIGQRFRLAEDYAFKASISRAYEGFRREAARIDKDMEARLLSSALARLDELPLRLVEPVAHGSPWQELAASDSVKQAMRAIPDFVTQIKDLAIKATVGTDPPKRSSDRRPQSETPES